MNVDIEMDVTGLFCPEPVMLLHKKVEDLSNGTVLKVLATDPATERDIPRFCHFLGHELLSAEQQEKHFIYLIRIVK